MAPSSIKNMLRIPLHRPQPIRKHRRDLPICPRCPHQRRAARICRNSLNHLQMLDGRVNEACFPRFQEFLSDFHSKCVHCQIFQHKRMEYIRMVEVYKADRGIVFILSCSRVRAIVLLRAQYSSPRRRGIADGSAVASAATPPQPPQQPQPTPPTPPTTKTVEVTAAETGHSPSCFLRVCARASREGQRGRMRREGGVGGGGVGWVGGGGGKGRGDEGGAK